MNAIRHPLVASSQQTCAACPEQYDGQLVDGRWFYFRYRYGHASIAVGPSLEHVQGQQQVSIRAGGQLDGTFVTEQQRDQVFADLLEAIQRENTWLAQQW